MEPVRPGIGEIMPGDVVDRGGMQIRLLTRAIEAHPDEPANYLLRGEEWLARGQCEQARADFLAARTRSESLLRQSAWGYRYQACIDRAEVGLSQCGLHDS